MKIVNVTKENTKLFNNIAIETSSMCNRHCHFCPNVLNTREDVLMPLSLIEKILTELSVLNYNGRIELYIYNEPTRDKRLLHLISMVRAAIPRSCIMINTNGDYFKSSKDIQVLFDAGLNQMAINIYSAADGSKSDASYESGIVKSAKRHEQIQGFVNELGIPSNLSMYQNIGSKKQVCKVYKKYGVRNADKTGTDFESISNRAGNIENFAPALKEPLVKYCTKPFRFLNINWKGDSLLCCNDYHGETNFGNVAKISLVDIWNNKKLNEYRLRLQNSNRNNFLCNGCDSNGGYYPHMITKVTFGKEEDKAILTKPFLK